MRAFAILFIAFAFVASAQALIQCLPDACHTVRCGYPNECRDPLTHELITRDTLQTSGKYRLVQGGGYCGCCHLCVKLLQENENCQSVELLGVPHRELCDVGLQCDHQKHQCVRA